MSFNIDGPHFGKASVCMPILRSLPDWFGIEQALIHYASEIDRLPTWLAYQTQLNLGFVSLKVHSSASAEVYVMAVRPEHHRSGIGRALLQQAQAWLAREAIEYLQVKTLGPSRPDEGYGKTRAFYQALGFKPLEEFKQLWNEQNPCLIMIKRL